MRDDLTRLQHMKESVLDAITFCRGRSPADLTTDRMLFLAVTRAIEIVGEAANAVSKETQERFPKVPWRVLVGMRNRLIHAYVAVDPMVVWETVKGDLPALVEDLDEIIKTLARGDG